MCILLGVFLQGFPFLFQQIRDCINLQQTRNLIISLTRFQPRLAEQIVAMIFNAIAKLNPEVGCEYLSEMKEINNCILVLLFVFM